MTAYSLTLSAHAPGPDNLLGIWSTTAAPVPASRGPLAWQVSVPDLAPTLLARASARLLARGRTLDALDAALGRRELSVEAALRAARAELRNMRQTLEQYLAFVWRATDALDLDALVETRIGERAIGWTRLPVVGPVQTVLSATISPAEADLHRRAVDLVARTRATMARGLVVLLQSAAILLTAISSPVGPLIAAVAAWRLVKRALEGTP